MVRKLRVDLEHYANLVSRDQIANILQAYPRDLGPLLRRQLLRPYLAALPAKLDSGLMRCGSGS